MTKHRSHSAAFKRQVAEEYLAGETLHALSQRHDISRQLIRIWVGKFEAGALDDDVQATDLLQEYEAKDRGTRADGWPTGTGDRASDTNRPSLGSRHQISGWAMTNSAAYDIALRQRGPRYRAAGSAFLSNAAD